MKKKKKNWQCMKGREQSRHKKHIPSMDPQWHNEDPSLGTHQSLDIFGRKWRSHLQRSLSKTDIFKWVLDLLEMSFIKSTPDCRSKLWCLEGASLPELWCFTIIAEIYHLSLPKYTEIMSSLLQTCEAHWALFYASMHKKFHFALN